MYSIQTVFHAVELSSNSLRDFVVFWNYDIQTAFHAGELQTNSLRAVEACWNYDGCVCFVFVLVAWGCI